MIVDLLRNDLAKNCRLGSIEVPQLCALESFANVHHLVSTVRGALPPHVSPVKLLADCFRRVDYRCAENSRHAAYRRL